MSGAKTLRDRLERADELGAEGRYFDAHEELELGWKAAAGDEKILLQGLIQVAAGLHRLANDPSRTDGAFYLLDRGLAKLRETAGLLSPGCLAPLEAALLAARRDARAPKSLRFGLRPR